MSDKPTQKKVVFRYFMERPNQEIKHADAVDWATEEWERLTGSKLRDPDRAIRTMYQDGILQKISTGVYKFDPMQIVKIDKRDFSAATRDQIFARDGYKCLVCGRGKREGVKLHADHVIPKENGGLGTLENGQTLCAEHNILKKAFGQFEFGKRLFEKYLEKAAAADDIQMIDFFTDVLDVFEKHNLN